MYVTPIILYLLLNTNQISCCKGKWYVRRFDPDAVQNDHIRGGSIHILDLLLYFLWVRLRILAMN